VVDQRVGAIPVLLDLRHDDTGECRHVFGLTGHPHVGPDDVDEELRPGRRPDGGGHREADAAGTIGGLLAGAGLKIEPVADVLRCGLSELALGHPRHRVAKDIDIDGRSHSEVAREQRRGPLDDPTLIRPVEAFEQPVVRHLALELRQRPSTGLGFRLQLVSQCPAERRGAPVGAVLIHWAWLSPAANDVRAAAPSRAAAPLA
jgi:hypothetical protein